MRERGGASYQCPRCHHVTRVAETRRVGKRITRRRICDNCDNRFTTVEVQQVDAPPLEVQK